MHLCAFVESVLVSTCFPSGFLMKSEFVYLIVLSAVSTLCSSGSLRTFHFLGWFYPELWCVACTQGELSNWESFATHQAFRDILIFVASMYLCLLCGTIVCKMQILCDSCNCAIKAGYNSTGKLRYVQSMYVGGIYSENQMGLGKLHFELYGCLYPNVQKLYKNWLQAASFL
jgi:hypothetical protein